MSSIAVGIDFGTSNSAVASFLGDKHQVLPDDNGQRLTPSVVAFGKNNQILIGHDAKNQSFKNPKRTVHSIKRLIGRKIFSSEIEKAQALLPFELVEGEEKNVAVKIDDQIYTPQEITSLILKHMKAIAQARLNTDVKECVITVPAYFNDSQRQATKEACEIAGLEVLRIINEPTAAALAYGFGKGLKENIAVYDLGGGTFDVSILKLQDKVFEVVATAGDTFLGGDDFDDRIMDIIAEDFLKKEGIDLRKIPEALPLLRLNAEKTKRRLSYAERSDLYIPGIFQSESRSLDLQFSLSRDQLKEHAKDLIQRTFSVCDEALNSASMKASDLDAVILVGGPTKMPLIIDAVRSYFGKEPLNDLNPDEVVSIGASIQAQSLKASRAEKKALLLDVTPLDLGVATVDGYISTLIEKNSQIPTSATKVFTTIKDNQQSVDIRVFQGKNRRIEESHLLGEFHLSGFKKMKAGEVDIEVSFSINTDGIVEVSARDPETGASQQISVKLAATMGKEKIKETSEKSKRHQEVRLKNKWKGASKIVAYVSSSSGSGAQYYEGYSMNFDPLADVYKIIPDDGSETEKEIEKKRVCWVAVVEDFANIPRYLKAITEEPQKFKVKPRVQLYRFTLQNGEKVFGQADLPKMREEGFWILPYFEKDDLPGKIFLFSAKIKESVPIQLPN